MYDFVEYELPLWPFGELSFALVKKDLEKIFNFRSQIFFKKFANKSSESQGH